LVDVRSQEQFSGPAVLNLSEPGPIMSPAHSGRDRTGRSRQSSISSQASGDARLYLPAAETARVVRQYAFPPDTESIAGDTDNAATLGTDALHHMTKDELFNHFIHEQQRAQKYKTRFGQVTCCTVCCLVKCCHWSIIAEFFCSG